MRMKCFLLDLGWLEVWLQVRWGRFPKPSMRRYRPVLRRQTDRVHDRLLHRLADTFSPERPV